MRACSPRPAECARRWGLAGPQRRLCTSGRPSPAQSSEEALRLSLAACAYRAAEAAAALPTPAAKEVALAVGLSSHLRKQLHREYQQEQQQQLLVARSSHRRLRRHAQPSSVRDRDERKNESPHTLSGFLGPARVSLPSKAASAHPLACAMVGLYLCCRYDLIDLAAVPARARSAVAQHTSGARSVTEFTEMWSRAGLSDVPLQPSSRERIAARAVERWSSSGRLPGRAPVRPRAVDVAALWEDVLQPFLCSHWGITVASDSAAPPALAYTFAFHESRARCLAAPLPWSTAESFLQLGRLPPSSAAPGSTSGTAAVVRTLLLEQLMAGDSSRRLFEYFPDRAEITVSPWAKAQLVALEGAQSAPAPSPDAARHESPPPLSPVRPSTALFPEPPPARPLSPTAEQLLQQQPRFVSILTAAQRANRVDLLFHIAQSSMRAVFNALMPRLLTNASGRSLHALADGVRWNTRYRATLGSLSSFLEAFDDVFFTVRYSFHSADGAGDLDAAGVEREVTAASAYTGPVGPWLLYGRLVAFLFPAHLPVPLGTLAEALSWGTYFAPRFGDLPSLLAMAGREVRNATLLPVIPAPALESTRSADTGRCLQLLSAVVSTVLAPDAAGGTDGVVVGPEAVRVPQTVAERIVRAHSGPVAGASTAEPAATVTALGHTLPLLAEWSGSAPSAHAPSLLLRRCVSSTASQAVERFVETYVCPHLRTAVPHALGVLADAISASALLRAVEDALPRRVSSAAPPPAAASLLTLLWVYTAAHTGATRDLWKGVHDSGSSGCWTRLGRRLKLTICSDVHSTGHAAVFVSPANGYSCPQDHLLTVNGLQCRALTPHDTHGDGAQAVWYAATACPRAGGSMLRVWPTAKPVSLMEVVAESDALEAVARSNTQALGLSLDRKTDLAPPVITDATATGAVDAVWWSRRGCDPASTVLGGDIIVWAKS